MHSDQQTLQQQLAEAQHQAAVSAEDADWVNCLMADRDKHMSGKSLLVGHVRQIRIAPLRSCMEQEVASVRGQAAGLQRGCAQARQN